MVGTVKVVTLVRLEAIFAGFKPGFAPAVPKEKTLVIISKKLVLFNRGMHRCTIWNLLHGLSSLAVSFTFLTFHHHSAFESSAC